MSSTLLTNTSLDPITRIIQVKFDILLSTQQVQALIARQEEELKAALQLEYPALAALEALIESISEEITGTHYPTEHSTPYYKEYFKKKLNENKHRYFSLLAE